MTQSELVKTVFGWSVKGDVGCDALDTQNKVNDIKDTKNICPKRIPDLMRFKLCVMKSTSPDEANWHECVQHALPGWFLFGKAYMAFGY